MEFCQLVCRSPANKINRRSRMPREGSKYRGRLITGKVRAIPLHPVTRIVCRFNRLRTHAKGICSDIPICRNPSFPPFFDRLALIGPRCAYSRRANSPAGFTFNTLRGRLNLLMKWIKFRNLGEREKFHLRFVWRNRVEECGQIVIRWTVDEMYYMKYTCNLDACKFCKVFWLQFDIK